MRKGIRNTCLLVWLLAVSPVLTSCSGEASGTISTSHEETTKRPTLAVAPLSKEPIIEIIDDLRDDLGEGTPAEVFQSFLKATLPVVLEEESAEGAFSEVRYCAYTIEPDLEEHVFELRKLLILREELRMDLPAKGVRVECEAIRADLLLFLQDFSVLIEYDYHPTEGPENQHLMYRTNFAIWDNDSKQTVSFGRAEGRGNVIVVMTKKTWEDAMKGLAESILEQSPFHP